jgi:exopolyphosphatase/pppGpp-phosphohydrolase
VFVYQELIDYYKKHNQSTEIITEKITSMLSQEGKEFSYNLNVYHSPAPIYNRQAKIVDTESNEFGIEFMRVLGMSLRNKIASGVRKTNTTYKTSPCGYIITDDIKKHLSYDIISKSIIVKYASVRKKCYEINSPVTINVYVRPDGLIVVDAELLKGSLNSIDYRHIQKKSSVLDSMFGE